MQEVWCNVARRWIWVTDNETSVKVLLLLLPYLWCASARQGCNLWQCMGGLIMCIGHDAPQLTCNHHQSVTYISEYNPLINAVVDYAKLHWSFNSIISAYLFKIVCSVLNHCGQLVLAIDA